MKFIKIGLYVIAGVTLVVVIVQIYLVVKCNKNETGIKKVDSQLTSQPRPQLSEKEMNEFLMKMHQEIQLLRPIEVNNSGDYVTKEEFDLFIENVIKRCPHMLSRLYELFSLNGEESNLEERKFKFKEIIEEIKKSSCKNNNLNDNGGLNPLDPGVNLENLHNDFSEQSAQVGKPNNQTTSAGNDQTKKPQTGPSNLKTTVPNGIPIVPGTQLPTNPNASITKQNTNKTNTNNPPVNTNNTSTNESALPASGNEATEQNAVVVSSEPVNQVSEKSFSSKVCDLLISPVVYTKDKCYDLANYTKSFFSKKSTATPVPEEHTPQANSNYVASVEIRDDGTCVNVVCPICSSKGEVILNCNHPNPGPIDNPTVDTNQKDQKNLPSGETEQVQNPPRPVTEEDLSKPVTEENLPKPITEENLPKPITEENLPKPITEENPPKLVTEENLPKPITEEDLSKPVTEENPPKPITEENPPKPITEENPPKLVTEENPPKPITEENPSKPVTEENPPKPVTEENPSKPIENSDKGSFFFRLPRYLLSFFQREQVVSKTDAVNSKEEPDPKKDEVKQDEVEKKEVVEQEKVVDPKKEEVKQDEFVEQEKVVDQKKEEVKQDEEVVEQEKEKVVDQKKEEVKQDEEVVDSKKEEVVDSKKEEVDLKKEEVKQDEEVVDPKKEEVDPKKEVVEQEKEKVVDSKKEEVKQDEEVVDPKKEEVDPKKEEVEQEKEKVVDQKKEEVRQDEVEKKEVVEQEKEEVKQQQPKENQPNAAETKNPDDNTTSKESSESPNQSTTPKESVPDKDKP